MRKIIMLISLLGLSVVAPSGAAHASLPACLSESATPQVVGQTCIYPPSAPIVTVDNSSPTPDSNITLTAQGFCPGTTVTFSVDGVPVGSAVADSSGKATLATIAPATTGTHVVVASSNAGAACTLTAQSSFAVGSAIPGTGSNTQVPLRAAAIAVLAGVLLLAVATIRRRHPRTVSA